MEHAIVGVVDESSRSAVDWVIDRAHALPMEITLICAADRTRMPPSAVHALLGSERERIGLATPRTVVHLVASELAVTQALTQASADADFVVLGTRTPIVKALSGASALRLAASSRCATVVVPSEWRVTDHTDSVLVGWDGMSSNAAIRFAASEAMRRGTNLEVVHTWTAPMPAFDPLAWIVDTEAELRAAHRQQLEQAIRAMKRAHPGLRAIAVLEECLPAAGLRARVPRAGLVVIGSHRHGPAVGIFLGSTAHELLQEPTIPLCIVPEILETKDHARRPGRARTAG
jgi:nucleotide-binding universal stress UspA family protein